MDDVRVKLLISGASGMLGSALSQSLTNPATVVLQLVRHEARESTQIRWNPSATQPIPDRTPLESLSAVIHLSGANVANHRWTPAYKREIWVSRVESTRKLAEALASLSNPPPVMIVASAVGIYGDRGDEVLDETSSPGSGFLADVCCDWESAARAAVDAGIRVVHARFGVVLGAGEGALGKMLPLFRWGLGGKLGSGRQWMSWIELTDAVAAIRFVLQNDVIGGPVNVTAPQPVTNADFTRALAQAVRRPAILPAPAFALRLALGEMADETLLSSARVLPGVLTRHRFRFAFPTLDKALSAALDSNDAPKSANRDGREENGSSSHL